ncbi:hypothetical protein DMN50_27790 [Priestia megaterium]|nr:hypothetical protein DMN50_27790 [Priestia megaterium]
MSATTTMEVLKVVIIPLVIGFGANYFSKFIDRRYLKLDKKEEYKRQVNKMHANVIELNAYVQQLRALTTGDKKALDDEEHFLAQHFLEEILKILKDFSLSELPEEVQSTLALSRSRCSYHIYEISRIKNMSDYQIEAIESTLDFTERIENYLVTEIVEHVKHEKSKF